MRKFPELRYVATIWEWFYAQGQDLLFSLLCHVEKTKMMDELEIVDIL